MWQAFSFHMEVISEIDQHFIPWEFEINSKAMRKVGPNESLVVVAESQAGVYLTSVPIRTLVMLG